MGKGHGLHSIVPWQELGMVRFRDLFACDPKGCAQLFVATSPELVPVEHYFQNLADVTSKFGQPAFCSIHNCDCKVPDSPRLDILVTGFPCAPSSRQRPGRHSSSRWTIWVEVLEY